MHTSVILIVFLAFLRVGIAASKTKFEFPTQACIGGLISGNILGCAIALANSVWKIHQWGEDTMINVCGNECKGNLKGRFYGLKWKWNAKFQCSTKGQGIVGRFTALGRQSAMKGAINDWIIKAANAGSINADDFKC
ncbi:unnamed protein product [Rotaria sp. Silwood1]|nr:unnamed protein product [Rotaria sp. Silwood1]